MNALIYDIEIRKGILGKGEAPIAGIEYCAGWKDHANMGVSVIGAYDYAEDRWRVFCGDNIAEFFDLATRRLLVGFNNIAFDAAVLRTLGEREANVLNAASHYDLLAETWVAAGRGREFRYPQCTGYGLDAMCAVNFNTRKTGNGALAPVAWQQGKIGEVVDYCLQDIKLTKQLFDAVLAGRELTDPKDGRKLRLAMPPSSAPDRAAR